MKKSLGSSTPSVFGGGCFFFKQFYIYRPESGGIMIITDRIRRDILSCLEQGYSKSKTLTYMIKNYRLYDGFVSARFIRDKEDMKKAIDAVDGKRDR